MGGAQSSPDLENIFLSTLLAADTVDWDLVTRLLQYQPEHAALYCHNSIERSPLQIALSKRGIPSSCVEAFLDAYDDAIDHGDAGGNTVAHTCVVVANGVDSLQVLLSKRHTLASQTNHKGKLPLHMYNIRDAKAARLLLDYYPNALKQRDSRGRIPLHYALDREEREQQNDDDDDDSLIDVATDVVRVFLDEAAATNSRIVLVRDKSGITPMHLLCQRLDACLIAEQLDATNNELSEEGSKLWQLFLDVLDMVCLHSKHDEPQLHRIVNLSGRPLSIVSYALQQFPEQVSGRNHLGQTPLHIAATNQQENKKLTAANEDDDKAADLISLLVTAYPPAARMTDHEGRLAIDLAAEYACSRLPHHHKAMTALIGAEPRALDTRDLRDRRYPFVSAAMVSQDVATTYYLLRAKPHVISYFHLD